MRPEWMAIAFVHPQIISRAGGRSAVACAAYRAGDKLTDERQGKTQDYERRSGVIASGILLPANAPEWMHDREKLWNAIERREDRSTRPSSAQLAREMVIALPHELDDQHREYLIKNIGQEATRQGMVFDYAIHAPDHEGDERNYHAHIMLTMRRIDRNDPDGFGHKVREWNRKTFFHDFTNIVERETNRMLGRCGLVDRITFHVVEREAQKHMGLAATQLERQGVQTEIGNENRAIRERNREREEARAIEAELKSVKAEITREEARQAKAERERQELEQHERKHAAAMAAATAERERREREQRERQAQRERDQAVSRAERERQELKQREQAQAANMAAATAERERRERDQAVARAERERGHQVGSDAQQVQAVIRQYYELAKNGPSFAAAINGTGLILARASRRDVETAKTLADLASHNQNAPDWQTRLRIKEGEYFVIDERGFSYGVYERTTGGASGKLASLGTMPLPDLQDGKQIMREMREQRETKTRMERERQAVQRANERAAKLYANPSAPLWPDPVQRSQQANALRPMHPTDHVARVRQRQDEEAQRQREETSRENAAHNRESVRDVPMELLPRGQEDIIKTPEQERKDKLLQMALQEFQQRELSRGGGGGRTRGR